MAGGLLSAMKQLASLRHTAGAGRSEKEMQLLSRFVCLFMVASVLGGGFFYPAPPIKDPVIV